MAIWKIINGAIPEPLALSGTALVAMVINLVCAVLLIQLRHGSALTRGAWLAARNDVAANILIIGAGLLMMVWASPWPDIVVGILIGAINLRAAAEVFEQARAEDPEIEED